MAYDFYQSAALILRYGFTAAGAFIAGRAAFMTVRDGRRARSLRARARETGVIAVLQATDARGKTREYPLEREGSAGSGRGSDVKIADCGLEKKHFYYEFRAGVLRVTSLDGAELRNDRGDSVAECDVLPGGQFSANRARFRFCVMRVKTLPVSPAARRAYGGTLRAAYAPEADGGGRRNRHGED